MSTNVRTGTVAGIGGVIILLAAIVAGGSLAGAASGSPAPEGFDRYLVYIADGEYDPADTGPADAGDFFQQQIMGRTAEEAAAQEQKARDFFEQRFGITAAHIESGAVAFNSSMLNPDWGYTAHTIAGESVPAEGWVVRDGGFSAVVMDPAGFDLGGQYAVEHAGQDLHVPQGTAFAFGDYNILVRDPGNGKHADVYDAVNAWVQEYWDTGVIGEKPELPGNQELREITLHYRSGDPLIVNQFGVMHFTCGLVDSADDLGVSEADWDGIAQGVVRAPMPVEGSGLVTASVRNVLTFPPN